MSGAKSRNQEGAHPKIDECARESVRGDAGQGRRKLAALSSSALALPGMAGNAVADAPIDRPSANYAFSYYGEDPLPFADWNGTGSRERYDIFSHQFNVAAPLTRRMDGSVDIVYESMSGASPWYVDQSQLQAMSGATIEENRVDALFSLNRYFDRTTGTLSGGISSENDYFSGNFAMSGQRSYNDKNTTIGLGLGFSWDTIEPTDPVFHGFEPGAEFSKKTIALDASFSQILYRNAIMQLGLSFKNSKGYLDDPYKRVFIIDSTEKDARPDKRNQLSLFARYRHFIPKLNAAVHGDVAYSWDNWEVQTLSLEAAWYQTLFEHFQIIPSFRYYSQSQASFYGPVFYFTDPEFATSDYRLSPFGAMTFGLKAQADWQMNLTKNVGWLFSVGYQRYLTDGGWALGSVDNASPGLVDYHFIQARLGARF